MYSYLYAMLTVGQGGVEEARKSGTKIKTSITYVCRDITRHKPSIQIFVHVQNLKTSARNKMLSFDRTNNGRAATPPALPMEKLEKFLPTKLC